MSKSDEGPYKSPKISLSAGFNMISFYLQAREEENARKRAEERERLEQQKQELHAKFRRVPPKFHSHNLGRKDSVQRETDLDVSENLLVSPVRSRHKQLVSTEVDNIVSLLNNTCTFN